MRHTTDFIRITRGLSSRAISKPSTLLLTKTVHISPKTLKPLIRIDSKHKSSTTAVTDHTHKSAWRDYLELAKPELSALVITTGTWGFLLTGCSDPIAGVSTIGGLVLAAASAAAWNQTVEVEHDKKMVRTRNRPLPTGRVSRAQSSAFTALTGVSGVALLTLGANPTAGFLGLSNILLYGMAYTPMKRTSVQNTHVGAVVGALPVVIGWTGGLPLLSVEPLVLFSILYAWQFPHFMGIAWKYRKDYKNAGYFMVSRDDPSAVRTSLWAINGAVSLCVVPFISTYVGMTSCMFIVSSAVPNAALLWSCIEFKRSPSGRTANKVIGVGFIYLMVFLALMFFHSTSEALSQHLNSARNILRRFGRELCVHETNMIESPQMCPVTAPNEMQKTQQHQDKKVSGSEDQVQEIS